MDSLQLRVARPPRRQRRSPEHIDSATRRAGTTTRQRTVGYGADHVSIWSGFWQSPCRIDGKIQTVRRNMGLGEVEDGYDFGGSMGSMFLYSLCFFLWITLGAGLHYSSTTFGGGSGSMVVACVWIVFVCWASHCMAACITWWRGVVAPRHGLVAGKLWADMVCLVADDMISSGAACDDDGWQLATSMGRRSGATTPWDKGGARGLPP